MKNLLWLLAGAWLIIAAALTLAGGQDREDLRGRFVGAWRLAWLEEPDSSGQKIHRADCSGLLVFTGDGHMAVQVMYAKEAGGQGGPVQYAQGGYEASFGTYQVNNAHTFTFHVKGAMVRSLIGKDMPRAYEFSGKQLIVHSTDPNEHWKVAWERD